MENGHEPATKQDVIDAVKAAEDRFFSALKATEDRVVETMRDVQTEVLTAFYGYTQTTDAKLKEGEQADIGLRQRLTAVESPVLEVEKRLNMPPEIQ
jgi:hypothetical protein